jgi:glycosyltransferase involved in cell wall biosynthesis
LVREDESADAVFALCSSREADRRFVSEPQKMKRVLLVTSSYAPTMIADMHRVRHLAWELPKLGWETEVLFPGAQFQRSEYLEPDSLPLFNPATPCHEVAPDDLWFFRPLKIRSIGWRALRPLGAAGDELMKRRRFDLVYISSANFPLFCLGRRWARQFNVPYVLDYHDPWVRDRLNYSTTNHKLKVFVVAKLSRWMERYAIRGAAGIVSVSPVYLEELCRRYGQLECLRPDRCELIPFAAREEDLIAIDSSIESSTASQSEIVYVGAGGSIMAKSFTAICSALAELRKTEPSVVAPLKIRLFGTYAYWKDGDPKPLQDIATRFGLGDLVEELPPRIGYLKAMELVRRCHGLLILGVDDPGYVPSKLFMYALSGKPLLASFRADAPSVRLIAEKPGLGHLLTFKDGVSPPDAVSVVREFVREVRDRRQFDRRTEIADNLALTMARRHVRLFERICSESSKSRPV